MPVYNGELYLAEAIRSIQRQTVSGFRMVICDNGSTDRSAAIAAEAAAADARIHLVRFERNRGAVANFLAAATDVATPYFCWAAHDDLRHPTFLERLIGALSKDSRLALAFPTVRNMNPDGSAAEVRPETASLAGIEMLPSPARIVQYLDECPGTPFYGVFRTEHLAPSLDLLRPFAVADGPPGLGLDMVFLASVIRRHPVVWVDETLLHFRRGGFSHRLGVYGTLWGLLRQCGQFARLLASETRVPDATFVERQRIRRARWDFILRYLTSPPMQRMFWHEVVEGLPVLERLRASCWVATRTPFRRLRRRSTRWRRGSRVVLFGAGKHTERNLGVIRKALGGRGTVVGMVDDEARGAREIDGLPVRSPAELTTFDPDLVLVSSDTYERQLFHRATECVPDGVPVWVIYDVEIEATRDCSMDSMPSRNSLMSPSETPESPDRGREAA